MVNQLYIKIKGESIDLNPSTSMEIEEENPFLQLNDELKGDYSFPLEVPMTDRNKKIFGHLQMLPTGNKLDQINDVQAGDNLEQMIGVLKKEQYQGNLNHFGTDKLSLYLLKGWSHFYKDIENKTLYDADYGGDRNFGRTATSGKYTADQMAHIHTVLRNGTPDLFDYAIFPFYNNSRIGQGIPNIDEIAKTYNFTEINSVNLPHIFNYLFTSFQPYLTYVIKRVFNSFGWLVDGFIFNDPDFKKIAIINTQYVKLKSINGTSFYNLRDHVPPIKVSSFLIALKNRLGLWYDFDYVRKRCTIRKLNDVFNGQNRINITPYCDTRYSLKIPAAVRVYGLHAGSEGIDFSKLNFEGTYTNKVNLPAPTASLAGIVIFVQDDNKYYICQLKGNSETIYEWANLIENDTGYLPLNKTDDITTICDVPISRVTDYNLNSNDEHYGKIVIPEVSLMNDNEDTDKFYICFHHGLQPDLPYPGKPTINFPFASPASHSINGQKLTSFSLSYQFFSRNGGGNIKNITDTGLFVTFWKTFLSKLNQKETMEVIVRFPQHKAVQLKWIDTLLINNVEFIIVKKSRVIPYKGELKLTLARI